MEKVIAFSNRTDGRDYATKVIQYSSKLLAWSLQDIDKSYHKKFLDLFRNIYVFIFRVMSRSEKDI